MSHLVCKTHRRRVQVMVQYDHASKWEWYGPIHRSDGSRCSSPFARIHNTEHDMIDIAVKAKSFTDHYKGKINARES